MRERELPQAPFRHTAGGAQEGAGVLVHGEHAIRVAIERQVRGFRLLVRAPRSPRLVYHDHGAEPAPSQAPHGPSVHAPEREVGRDHHRVDAAVAGVAYRPQPAPRIAGDEAKGGEPAPLEGEDGPPEWRERHPTNAGRHRKALAQRRANVYLVPRVPQHNRHQVQVVRVGVERIDPEYLHRRAAMRRQTRPGIRASVATVR